MVLGEGKCDGKNECKRNAVCINIIYILIGGVYLPPPMSYVYIENSKEDEQHDNMMCFWGCDVLFF